MTGAAILLVLLSAVAHAAWNLLVRRATTPELFTWWMAVAATAFGAPVAAYFLITEPPAAIGWAFVGVTVVLHTGYFTFLGKAYQHGDLSVVYPAARGLGIALVPALAYAALDESLSWPAVLGVVLVLTGIFVVASSAAARSARGPGHTPRRVLGPGLAYALLTGLVIAGYSVIDKRGVQHVHPALYVVLLTAGGGAGMLLSLRLSYSRKAFVHELRSHAPSIAVAGVLQTAAYGLVLFALRVSPVSYVAPFREVGVVFGVAMGALVLKEKVSRLRVLGAGAVGLGAIVIALAP